MDTRQFRFETKLVHSGEPRPLIGGSVTLPIFQSSTYEYAGELDYDDVRYVRLSNTPNHLALATKIAEVENAEAAVVTSSGMAAISTALLGLVGEGEHLLAQESVYGGTYHFLKENFSRMGRKVTFFPLEEIANLEKYRRPETRAIYVESISNPMLNIVDLPAVVAFAKQRGLTSMIDNTFASPVNFNPTDLGFDVVLHSATKYLNGHTDLAAGVVVGRRDTIRRVTHLLNHLGASLDPHACFLLSRGMKTLGVRVRWQNDSALALAKRLAEHPKVSRVHYPGLASHLGHERARAWFRGFGGMLSFEYDGSAEQTDVCLKRLTLPISAPSLGGVETLVTRPATTSHAGVPREERLRFGITDTLVRVSVGLEDPHDLIADFLQALG